MSGRLPGDNWQRQEAFTEFMTDRFGGIRDGYVQVVDNSLAGGEAALRAVLELEDQPTAVVTSTDLVAVGVLHAAYSMVAWSPTSSRSWASTTSSSPPTRSPR